MIAAIALFLTALVLRGASRNRHIRARLLASAVVAAIYALLAATLQYGELSADMRDQILPFLPLLVVFGVVNTVVALVINPWRVDRLPDRFPTIVQDAIVIGLFALAATILLQEKIFAAAAAGAVVVGLALQDTLGNLFAGLAIQIEKPFRVGHWVRIADIDGLVTEVTWRATKVRTKAGNFVVVPNSKLADDIIINYSEPTPETRIEVEVGVSYDNAPNDVKRTIQEALKDDLQIQQIRSPEVLVWSFDESSINYRIWAWITEFAAQERVQERIRSALFYAFRRHGIVIPYPIQVQIEKDEVPPPPRDFVQDVRVLGAVPAFAELADEERAQLARATIRARFGAGESIVRQGEAGASMFIVASGEVVVSLEPGNKEVARMGAGGFFGEMSLLTGAPRNATVRTTTDSELIEIPSDGFRHFVLANPRVVEQVGAAVARRQMELERRRAAGSEVVHVDTPDTLVDRIRRFLGLVGLE